MAIIFGVFDRLHDGHRFFLREVHNLLKDDEKQKIITVIVTPDVVAEARKGKNINRQSQTVRCQVLKSFCDGLTIVMGDEKEGEYSMLRKKLSSQIICLGYDQQKLLTDLTERMNKCTLPRLSIRIIDSFQPDKLHTSLLYPVTK